MRALAVALVAMLGAALIPRPAVATDINELRRRAQSLANTVSSLEHRRAGLADRAGRLRAKVTDATAEIGRLELELSHARTAIDKARELYVQRAIEAYKSGPATRLAMLLSARSLGELVSLAEAQAQIGSLEGDALQDLLAAHDDLRAAQDEVDDRQQFLLAAQVEAQGLENEIDATIDDRSARLADMTKEIKSLEEQARLAAAASASGLGISVGEEFLRLLAPSGPSPNIPNDFASTGVSFEGIASWYGPGFEGNPTASGDIFDPDLYTAASKELPLGTWLYVQHQSRGVVVLVNDRGPYIDGRILDLSRAAAFSIGITGLGWVKATILVKK